MRTLGTRVVSLPTEVMNLYLTNTLDAVRFVSLVTTRAVFTLSTLLTNQTSVSVYDLR
jgi:hypothetical protein